MKWQAKEESAMKNIRIRMIAILAIYNFIFLGAEYWFDNMMAYSTDAYGVVLAQSYILGASAIGFFLFPLFRRKMQTSAGYIGCLVTITTVIICLFVISQHISHVATMVSGCMAFLLLGIVGSAVHYLVACTFARDDRLARTAGAAYAAGLLLQFINNNFVSDETIEPVILSVFLVAGGMLLMGLGQNSFSVQPREEQSEGRILIGRPGAAGGILLVNVVLMTCIFATLDNAVTLVHASGHADIGQWPRLLLALSGLAAGVLFDWKNRRFMNILMYCVTLLSTICVVIIELGGPFLAGLIVFYLSAGFFVVFFTTSFIELSVHMKTPELWAGLGRTTNNLCAVLTSAGSLALLRSGNGMLISVVALVFFALISVTSFLYSGRFAEKRDEIPKKGQTGDVGQEEDGEKFDSFCERFSLTKREQEVLSLLLQSDGSAQELADTLFISRAALYRHMASLNEKTKTKSRIGLIQFYYAWKNTN